MLSKHNLEVLEDRAFLRRRCSRISVRKIQHQYLKAESTGGGHFNHTTHPSSTGEVQHCLRRKAGGTQASEKEADNKPTLY